MTVTNPELRAARKGLRMVAELHVRGYQRLRIVPGMSGSGMSWRCAITPTANTLRSNGARCSSFDWLTARYTSADEQEYFGWADAAHASPSRMAELFVERFPEIAVAGYGQDWEYAGWYQHMMHLTYPNAFPIASADWTMPGEWLPTVGQPTTTRVPLPPPGEAEGGFGEGVAAPPRESEKHVRYAALVAARKQYDPTPFGLTNPSQIESGRFDSDHVGPWTRWAHDLDADLMVVGQDWGDDAYFVANRGFDNPTNPTNRALQALMQSIGCPLSSPPSATDATNTADADRASCGVWLTNAPLWLKRGGLSAKVEEAWFDDPAAGFLLEQIEIVQPQVVVAPG